MLAKTLRRGRINRTTFKIQDVGEFGETSKTHLSDERLREKEQCQGWDPPGAGINSLGRKKTRGTALGFGGMQQGSGKEGWIRSSGKQR